MVLKHSRCMPAFRGRLRIEERKAIFVADATWIEVRVGFASSARQTGHDVRKREIKLYNALRGEHAKANQLASLAARQQTMQAQLPTAPGDMAVRRKTDVGKLVYAWNDVEVDKTPQSLRAPGTEGQSYWQQTQARETTPERALRKMKRKGEDADEQSSHGRARAHRGARCARGARRCWRCSTSRRDGRTRCVQEVSALEAVE